MEGMNLATPSPKNLYIGAGQIFFDRFDENNNRTGLRHLGNVPKFNLKSEVTKVQKKSSMDAAKSIYDEAVTEIKNTADLTIEEFDPSNLALALYGSEGVIKQTADIITNEKHKAYKGRYIQLNGYKVSDIKIKRLAALPASISAAVAVGSITSTGTVTAGGTYTGTTIEDYYVTISTAPSASGNLSGCKIQWKKGLSGVLSNEVAVTTTAVTLEAGIQIILSLSANQTFVVGDTWKVTVSPLQAEYIAGVDYKIDNVQMRGGLILIPETSTIPDGTDVFVDYKKAEATLPKIAAATSKTIQGYLLFLGDPSKGPAYNGEFWKVTITPNGDAALIGDEYAGFQISVTILNDKENHPDDPVYRLVKLN